MDIAFSPRREKGIRVCCCRRLIITLLPPRNALAIRGKQPYLGPVMTQTSVASKSDDPADRTIARRAEVATFLRARYGPRGTLALHREAIGLDLLRAPVNVVLAPLFLLIRLLSATLSRIGAPRAGAWLAGRRIFLKSDVARRIETDLTRFIADLDEKGLGPGAHPDAVHHQVATLAETRNAVSEITTSLIVLALGYLLLHRATPGVISLAGPLAEMRKHSTAVQDFLLGNAAGRLWYRVFPVELPLWEVALTGVALAVAGSLITTFAGLIADPVQLWSGTHHRRTMRLLERLDKPQPASGIEREHVFARMGDLSDAAVILWRNLRG